MAEAEAKGKGAGLLKQAVGEMSMTRRMVFMGAGALILAGLVSAFLWVNQPEYQVLFSGLAQRDASQVVNKLKDLKVPYRLEADGTLIRVPQENVYEARLALAGDGLPRGSGIGFEVFNKVEMGTTDFVQKINYQRALQGELARTIASFAEITEARVHIVMPRDSLFVEEEKKPSAAVVVALANGKSLSPSQIAGIVHLVASSVPDLSDDRITLVDTKGNLIFRKQADTPDFAAGLTAGQMDHQRNYEKAMRGKVQSMLEEVLGQGRAVVRVAADLDFTRITTTEDLFNPDQVVVRSETKTNESGKNAGQGPTGSPDQRFNLAQRNATPGAEAGGGSETSRESETTNFEISRTQKQITQAGGNLKRMTVAVVVDGPYKEEGAPGGPVNRVFNPRSAEEMRQLTELVRRAVGYNEQRGDEVTVANVPFALASDSLAPAAKGWQDYLKEYGKPALNLILGLLFILLVARPLIKMLAARMAPAPAMAGAGAGRAGRRAFGGEELTAGEAGEMALLEETPRKVTTRDQVVALTSQDPDRATAVLRAWIREA